MLKIRIKTDEGKRYRFILPDGPIMMRILLKQWMKENTSFDKEKYNTFMKVYRQVKRLHPRLVLVDVQSTDGTKVLIKL